MARQFMIRLVSLLAAVILLHIPVDASAQRAQSHTVRKGDTLWDLARQYLGDPFLWPALYGMNTDVVEDPHWIYPGETLRLVAGGDVRSVPAEDTPLPAADVAARAGAGDTMPRSDDWRRFFVSSGDRMRFAVQGMGQIEYRPLRQQEFYSSGFLTEGRDLPLGRLVARVTPVQIPAHDVRESMQLFMRVLVTAPSGATYAPGDSLLVVELRDPVSGHGRMVIPTGMLQVLEVGNDRIVAEVIAMYQAVTQGQHVMAAEPFQMGGTRRAVPVADGVTAKVLGGPLHQTLVGPQDVLFIDKGRADGVAAGDLFEIRRHEERRASGATSPPDVMAVVQVVRVGEHSSTTRVLTVSQPSIAAGAQSRQIARLPS